MIISYKIFYDNPVKKGQKSRVIATIFVDDVSELPAYNEHKDFDFAQGSVAYVIHSGELYVMDSNGKWFSSEGQAIPETQ